MITRQDVNHIIRANSNDEGNAYIYLYNAFGKKQSINLWYESKTRRITKMQVLEELNLLEIFYEFVKEELSVMSF